MAVPEAPPARAPASLAERIFASGYRVFAYFGLMTLSASLVLGFRFDPAAPWYAYLVNIALYLAFIAPHLIMTRSWYKRAVWGNPAGSLRDRQFYIVTTVVSLLAVLYFHWPVPGPAFELPEFVRFAGVVGFLWSMLLFFQGSTLEALDGLVGMPTAAMQYSHGGETPLFTDGPYAQVRHPMYRALVLMGLCSLAIHPNAGQLLWTVMIGGSFLAFIPIEEAQLVAARGDEYRRYRKQTPYRLFRGVW